MTFTELFTDDDAVSPVIGVILMVAITVILAAVIATFVLGLGDQVSNTAPQASFSFDYDAGTTSGDDNFPATASYSSSIHPLTITHDGGDTIEAGNIRITGGDSDVALDSGSFATNSEISAGSSWDYAVEGDDTVRVVYQSSTGDSSATLGKWSGPDA